MSKLPKVTKEQLAVIEQCAQQISSSNWIPGYEKEDIRQEAIIIGIKAIVKYNGSIPLDKFMSNRMKQRLISLRRLTNNKPECNCGTCLKCTNYTARMKINRASELPAEDSNKSLQYEMEDILTYSELSNYLDHCIPAEYREDYLKILAGVAVPIARKQKLRELIKDLLDD